MSVALALAALAAAPATLVAPAPVVAEAALDPARLAAAKRVLDILMPPESRAAMFDTIMAPMFANVRQTMLSTPIVKDRVDDPRLRAIVDRMMERQEQRLGAMLTQNLPGMFVAMERAYARRFTVAQLDEVRGFFATPTGRLYMAESMKIMSDPDILAWQRGLMQGAMANVQDDMKTMIAEIEAETAK